MDGRNAGPGTLSRPAQRALRTLLVRATVASDRATVRDELDELVHTAPVAELPSVAALHRLTGSVLRGLDGVRDLPVTVHARLSEQRERARLRHLLTVGALSQVAKAFTEAGLSWVAVKGPVLAGRLYADAGDRSYNDLDLLVVRHDFPQAVRILESLGYRHIIHNWALAEEMLAGQIAMSGMSVHVDLHWHFHYSEEDRRPFGLDPEAMVERARRVAVDGVEVPTLDRADTLLTLAFHAARSGGHRLVWLKDIERAVAAEPPEYAELVRRCRAYRCAPPVGLILRRARSVLGAAVPDEVVGALLPATLRATDRVLLALAQDVTLHDRETLTRIFTRSVRSSLGSSLAATPRRAVRFVQRSFFPPTMNETDSPEEKERYLASVSHSTDR